MVLVVELDDLVISYAIWERWGAANGYWGDQKTRYPLELERTWPPSLRPPTNTHTAHPDRRHSFDTSHNPAPSPLPRAAQWRSHSDACHSTITQHFTGAHIECYYLHRLVTHGDFEGRGAGSMLVQWGVDRAKREGVVYGCESTTLGYGFYKRFGMREVSGVDGWIMRSALEEVAAPAVVPEGEDAIPVVQADNGEVPVGSVPGTKVAPSAPPEVSIPVAVPSLSVAKLTGLPLDVLVPEPPLDGLRAALQSVSIAS